MKFPIKLGIGKRPAKEAGAEGTASAPARSAGGRPPVLVAKAFGRGTTADEPPSSKRSAISSLSELESAPAVSSAAVKRPTPISCANRLSEPTRRIGEKAPSAKAIEIIDPLKLGKEEFLRRQAQISEADLAPDAEFGTLLEGRRRQDQTFVAREGGLLATEPLRKDETPSSISIRDKSVKFAIDEEEETETVRKQANERFGLQDMKKVERMPGGEGIKASDQEDERTRRRLPAPSNEDTILTRVAQRGVTVGRDTRPSEFEAMPIESFGLAMIMGMGYDPDKPSSHVETYTPVRRAFIHAGLGADKDFELPHERAERERKEKERRAKEAIRHQETTSPSGAQEPQVTPATSQPSPSQLGQIRGQADVLSAIGQGRDHSDSTQSPREGQRSPASSKRQTGLAGLRDLV